MVVYWSLQNVFHSFEFKRQCIYRCTYLLNGTFTFGWSFYSNCSMISICVFSGDNVSLSISFKISWCYAMFCQVFIVIFTISQRLMTPMFVGSLFRLSVGSNTTTYWTDFRHLLQAKNNKHWLFTVRLVRKYHINTLTTKPYY